MIPVQSPVVVFIIVICLQCLNVCVWYKFRIDWLHPRHLDIFLSYECDCVPCTLHTLVCCMVPCIRADGWESIASLARFWP